MLDEEYALLEVSLKPNQVVKFPPPVKSFNSYYEQQFNNYGKDFWLLTNVRIDGTVKISMVGLEFPLIQFRQLSRITNYQINVALPDSLYEKERIFMVDSASVAGDSLRVTSIETVPLSKKEKEAYASLDGTATLEKAFKPSGFLARFVNNEDDEQQGSSGSGFLNRIPGSLSPDVRFNRVDELYAGLSYNIRPSDRLRFRANGGYSTGYEQYVSFSAGHNFRTIPFEAAGLNFLSDRNIGLIVFGGLARTWFSENRQTQLEVMYGYSSCVADNLHIEADVSLNSLFGLFRVDVAVRLAKPAFLINYSLARLF